MEDMTHAEGIPSFCFVYKIPFLLDYM